MKHTGARRLALTASLAALGAGVATPVHAFSEPRSYYDGADEGGGGGRWFTGSPAEGYGCNVCHTGGAPPAMQIEGLPSEGYVPGASYELRIAWPEFAARAQALAQTPGAPVPSMLLVAEFVAETGLGAGSIEIASIADATPGERCTFPPDTRATLLYAVKSGEPAAEQETRCDAGALEERCILAVSDCGAQEVRLRWTAPDSWQRTIWFAAGFVATEASSDTPEADGVNQGLIALRPAASESEHYASQLEGGCSASCGRLGAKAAPVGVALASAAVLRLRARKRRDRRSA